MPAATPLSPSTLHLLLPLREVLASQWETVLAEVASAPDPALAAAHLSRLAEHGFGSGAVIGTPDLCRDLLCVLGSSQYLTTVLLSQEQAWEATFLADRQSSVKSADAHLASLRTQLSLDLPEENYPRDLRTYRDREYFGVGERDLMALASLEDTVRELSNIAEEAVQVAY